MLRRAPAGPEDRRKRPIRSGVEWYALRNGGGELVDWTPGERRARNRPDLVLDRVDTQVADSKEMIILLEDNSQSNVTRQ